MNHRSGEPETESSLRYRQSDRLAARMIDGKGVVIVIDRQELHTLNEVGMRVFELAKGRSADEIAQIVANEFQVETAEAQADAKGFLDKLVELGALEVMDSEA